MTNPSLRQVSGNVDAVESEAMPLRTVSAGSIPRKAPDIFASAHSLYDVTVHRAGSLSSIAVSSIAVSDRSRRSKRRKRRWKRRPLLPDSDACEARVEDPLSTPSVASERYLDGSDDDVCLPDIPAASTYLERPVSPTSPIEDIADEGMPAFESVTTGRRMSCPGPSPGYSFKRTSDIEIKQDAESPRDSPQHSNVGSRLLGLRFPFNVFSAREPNFTESVGTEVPEEPSGVSTPPLEDQSAPQFNPATLVQRLFGRSSMSDSTPPACSADESDEPPAQFTREVVKLKIPKQKQKRRSVSCDRSELLSPRSTPSPYAVSRVSDSVRALLSPRTQCGWGVPRSMPRTSAPGEDFYAPNSRISSILQHKHGQRFSSIFEADDKTDPPPLATPGGGSPRSPRHQRFVKQVRNIMSTHPHSIERKLTVVLSGVLWKQSREKSVKNALGKMLETTHWATNVKKGVNQVKQAWGNKTDFVPVVKTCRIVEICMVNQEDKTMPYLRWARIPRDMSISGAMSPAPCELSQLPRDEVKEKPLLGSLVLDRGVAADGGHVMHIYFPWETRHSALPYEFSFEHPDHFNTWFDALRKYGSTPEPTAEDYKKGTVSAKLSLDILRVPQNGQLNLQEAAAFCIVHFKDVYVARTPCALITGDDDLVKWDHKIDIVIDRDDPDECFSIEMYIAPQYADGIPNLLGKTNIPLWFFERHCHTDLCLDLKNPEQLRRGVASAHPLKIHLRGYLHQPLRSVFMPLELPSHLREEKAELDFIELSEFIFRVEALIKLYEHIIDIVKSVLFWDCYWYSFAWLLLITVWFLWIPEYTLSIVLALVSFYTIAYHRDRARQFAGKLVVEPEEYESVVDPDETNSPVEASPTKGVYFERKSGKQKLTVSSVSSEEEPTRFVYENERRWPFTQFDPQYLLTDIDFPHYMDKQTHIAVAQPKSLMIDRDGLYHYRWAVHITPETDENGWQYAANVTSTQWRSLYNSFDCFFRRRLHVGYRLVKAETANDKDGEEALSDSSLSKQDLNATNANRGNMTRTENATSELGMWKQHKSLYCKTRNDVEIVVRLIEKYKNIFSGRLKWLTDALKVVLLLATLASIVFPTRIVVWWLVTDYFRSGWVAGRLKRSNIEHFTKLLRAEIIGNRRMSTRSAGFNERWRAKMSMEEFEFAPLELRNWINRTFKIKLSLKQLASCKTLYHLGALVVELSNDFLKMPLRDRTKPWVKFVDNLLDHVPSDLCRFQIDNAAYSQ